MDAPEHANSERKLLTLHQGLINQLKQNGHISTPRIEAAFRAIPRHLFLPHIAPEEVYQDQAIATKSLNESIVSSSSQPTIMAIMLEQLQLQPGQRVLEIGAGTGYNAALMAHIVGELGQVVTVDIDEDIVEGARAHLATAGLTQVLVVCADGFDGYPAMAPYDRIILTVHAADIAPAWYEQLRSDGRLVLPLSLRGPQVSVAFVPVKDYLASTSLNACGFVGLRGVMAEDSYTVVLSPEEALSLRFGEPRTVPTEMIYQWLHGPVQDLSLPIQITYQELFYRLCFWLAVHNSSTCNLLGRLDTDLQQVAPLLFRHGRKTLIGSTIGLLSEHGLCLLTRDPSQMLSAHDGYDPRPFTLWIRSFGHDPALATDLGSLVMDWQRAGRPNEQQLQIRAYPQGVKYTPDKGDIVVEKRWLHFVFKW